MYLKHHHDEKNKLVHHFCFRKNRKEKEVNIFLFLATSHHLFLSKALQQLQLQHLGSSWLAGSSTSACELF